MKKNEKGFTLVELMIVVAIIAILAAVALPAFGNQIKKSKDGKAVQMMGTMRSQLGMVQADLEGSNPKADALNITGIFVGGTVTGADSSSITSNGIQGFGKLSTTTATGGQMNVGRSSTAATGGTELTNTTWTYTNATGTVQFTANYDSKGKAWASY